jgi:hypothetical protein
MGYGLLTNTILYIYIYVYIHIQGEIRFADHQYYFAVGDGFAASDQDSCAHANARAGCLSSMPAASGCSQDSCGLLAHRHRWKEAISISTV